MKKTFRRAFIEITNECNLACGFCASSSRPKSAMSLETFERAAAQAGNIAAVIFPHLLGEPFMHPRFPEVLAACSRLGLKLNLVTNGLLLDKFGPDIFSEKCLGQVSVSLHTLSGLPAVLRAQSLLRFVEFARHRPPGLIVSFRLRGNPGDAFIKETKTFLLGALAEDGAGERVRDGLKLRHGVYLNFGGIFDWPGGPGGRA